MRKIFAIISVTQAIHIVPLENTENCCIHFEKSNQLDKFICSREQKLDRPTVRPTNTIIIFVRHMCMRFLLAVNSMHILIRLHLRWYFTVEYVSKPLDLKYLYANLKTNHLGSRYEASVSSFSLRIVVVIH